MMILDSGLLFLGPPFSSLCVFTINGNGAKYIVSRPLTEFLDTPLSASFTEVEEIL